ncbi:DUF4194 domain-containing protein [Kibdelosporangium philippinense]|uniref:DUF4194 domain-containing protein n=1 Tax=Kibdelosporangium philippinense TaxID=211113 RepID=A0ABS8ZQJ9_9PSEU|nr:DUF4194 domain-containing protein [Kibdelosporangium philippinense]MCE7009995.1 DUF4194 domain-containing protein [Kibdelosporangium philippinense]
MSSDWGDVDEDVDAFGERDGDPSRLPLEAKRALVVLLKSRFVSRAQNRPTWDSLLAYEQEITGRLGDLFLELVIDRDLEVAFKRQNLDEDAPKVLRREKPLSRDASFLLVFLRQEWAYAADGPVVVNRSQVEEFLRAYREEGDGDRAKFERRVNAAIGVLGDMKLLSVDQDADYLFTVSPVVVPLIGVDEFTQLEAAYLRGMDAAGSSALDADNGPLEPEEQA